MDGTGVARAMVGYDGSVPAGAAIEVGAALLPAGRAWITHLWAPPMADEALRRRLWKGAGGVNEFVEAIEREGAAEADRIAAMGVTLAQAAGWTAEPLVERTYGGDGLRFAELAAKFHPDLVLVGSRGLGGTKALGSVAMATLHHAHSPVLVVPSDQQRAE